MSGTHLPFLSIGTDPLDDPLNLEWDAIVRNERPAAPEIDPDDFDLLRPCPSTGEPRAAGSDILWHIGAAAGGTLAACPIVKPRRQPRLGREHRSPVQITGADAADRAIESLAPPGQCHGGTASSANCWLRGAAASRAGELGETPAIPAASSHEPFINPSSSSRSSGMLAVPGATTWTDMLVSIQKLDPGKPFTTNVGFYLGNDGPLIIMVLNGELELTPGGPAYLYRAGSDPKHPRAGRSGPHPDTRSPGRHRLRHRGGPMA